MSDIFATSQMAAGYARSRPAVHPYVIARIREHLRIETRVACALDIGCGAGLSTAPLHTIASRSIGIDPWHDMVRRAFEVAPRAHFAVAAAEALPFPSASIDLITAAGSLNYVDASRFWPEGRRVLAEKGTLVVYDFSQGREFRDSAALGDWFTEFEHRYPLPFAREITPETLRTRADGFRLTAHEHFEHALLLSPEFYLDYMMTESNVAQAIRGGTPEEEIRAWCSAGLSPVFSGGPREVIFRGYIAYLRP